MRRLWSTQIWSKEQLGKYLRPALNFAECCLWIEFDSAIFRYGERLGEKYPGLVYTNENPVPQKGRDKTDSRSLLGPGTTDLGDTH